jgi:hypothetical protein
MKVKVITYVASVFYFLFCIFVIAHNASFRLDLMFEGEYLVFLGFSVLVYIVLSKVIQEVNTED